jgi:serine/threonine protein kinase/Tol biopolymer transport system component
MIGSSIAHYRITAKIGEGGMGEVYRAADDRLNRDVAIKLLPENVENDPARLARFRREAQMLAALSHGNIAAVYGLEEQDGRSAIVLELVEGEDLSERIARGALAFEDARDIALQIAEAFEAAHEKGIIHRDLKPANVKITPDGTVKVLDFGLAKALEGDSTEQDISASPTMTAAATQAGMILGTAAYMAPEQAKGKRVDRRADVWAFGCVLYEMLTGRAPFAGDGVSEVLAHVITQDPDLDALPSGLPAQVTDTIRRCLRKDPRMRLPDIAAARIALTEASESGQPEEVPRTARANRLPWAIAALALLLSVALLAVIATRKTPTSQRIISGIPAPEGGAFAVIDGAPALSHDGNKLAFVAIDSDGTTRIFVRSLESTEARPLVGTEDAQNPFWSPDGRRLGFFAGGFLKTIELAGGSPEIVTRVEGLSAGGSWNSQGTIVFGIQDTRPLRRVSASGGEAELLGALVEAGKQAFYQWPRFLPDGEHVLFNLFDLEGGKTGIYVARLDAVDEAKFLVGAQSNASYVEPGYLLYTEEGTLLARGFDPESLQLTEETLRLAENVTESSAGLFSLYSASQDGRLVYLPRIAELRSVGPVQLVIVDRKGTQKSLVAADADFWNPRLSHDGTRLAVDITDIAGRTFGDIWVLDLEREARTRVTRHATDESVPVWSPDDSEIYFYRIPDLFVRDASGVGAERLVWKSDETKQANDVSPDGRHLLFSEHGESGSRLWLLDLQSGQAEPWIESDYITSRARFSPDGDWVAYISDETGRPEVYITNFPEADRRVIVSADGGHNVIWSHDGSELYYHNPAQELVAIPIDWSSGDEPRPGKPESLFRVRLRSQASDYSSSPIGALPDGSGFLVNRLNSDGTDVPLVLVQGAFK